MFPKSEYAKLHSTEIVYQSVDDWKNQRWVQVNHHDTLLVYIDWDVVVSNGIALKPIVEIDQLQSRVYRYGLIICVQSREFIEA